MAGLTDTGQAVTAWVSEQDTLRRVSHRMNELGLAVLTVRGDDDRDWGLISREMIIACMTAGGHPKTVTASEIAQRTPPAGQAETAADGGPVSATGAGTRYPHATAVEQVADYALLAGFRSLPAESQSLIYLADVTGLSYRQIAGVLGLPAEAVAARLHLIRQRLRRGFCPSDPWSLGKQALVLQRHVHAFPGSANASSAAAERRELLPVRAGDHDPDRVGAVDGGRHRYARTMRVESPSGIGIPFWTGD